MERYKIHSGHIELAVANLINYRVNTIVPNVSWGFMDMGHEADLLVLDKNQKLTEIEIKISLQDLKADFKKRHNHFTKYITRLVYAIPIEMLEKSLGIIPKDSNIGIIVVKWVDSRYVAEWYRNCRHKLTYGIGDNAALQLMNLGCMRIWTLKEQNYVLQHKNKLIGKHSN